MRSLCRRLYARPAAATMVKPYEPRWQRWGKRILMSMGAFVLCGMLLGMVSSYLMNRGAALPPEFILTTQMTGALDETPERISFFALPEKDFYAVLDTLREGARDPKVKALAVRIWNGPYSLSQIKDIHDVLKEWKAAGKPTYAYTDSLGDGGTGMAAYWLASGFDQIWVQPLGMVTVNGFRAEMPFARDALRKLGVVPEFFPYTNYKSAMDMFLRSSISPKDREQLQQVVDGLTDDFIKDVSRARKIDEAKLRGIIKGAPYLAEDARTLGLIDRAGYEDELSHMLRAGPKGGMPVVSIIDYLPHALNKPVARHKTGVALINLEGMITDLMTMPEDVQDQGGLMTGTGTMCVSCAISRAGDDPHIKAILLRVNSPGGSPTASETIRRAIFMARMKGKKVIVSMGDTAASGGYWIASAADKIIAQPTTLTGSIGVVGGKFAARELFAKYGVNWDEVAGDTVSPAMGSFINPYTPEAAAREKTILSAIYDGFKARVEQGRPIKDAEAVAQGRVWLGVDAKAIKLVDVLGGYRTAQDETAKALGLASALDLNIVNYMPAPSPFSGLRALLGLPRVMSGIQKQWMDVQASINAPVQAKADLPTIRY